jgi:hypothetical protein
MEEQLRLLIETTRWPLLQRMFHLEAQIQQLKFFVGSIGQVFVCSTHLDGTFCLACSIERFVLHDVVM